MSATIHRLPGSQDVTLGEATRAYLGTLAGPDQANTRRAYFAVLRRLAEHYGPDSAIGAIGAESLAEWFTATWSDRAAGTWNARGFVVGPTMIELADSLNAPIELRIRPESGGYGDTGQRAFIASTSLPAITSHDSSDVRVGVSPQLHRTRIPLDHHVRHAQPPLVSVA
jgi:hypothetical protein